MSPRRPLDVEQEAEASYALRARVDELRAAVRLYTELPSLKPEMAAINALWLRHAELAYYRLWGPLHRYWPAVYRPPGPPPGGADTGG